MSHTVEEVLQYLHNQDIHATYQKVKPSFIDIQNELSTYKELVHLPYAKQTLEAIPLQDSKVIAMSLASMTAVRLLDLDSSMNVLDTCSAPGMKALYANVCTQGLNYYVNDVSSTRLSRLVRLFDEYGFKPKNITKYNAQFIHRAYDEGFFDRIIIDAPCSGEGVILGGNHKLLETWSPAKVKRLQQLQIGILKSAWKLLRPGGRLIYATCTLNKNENERVIKKALGIDITVTETTLDVTIAPQLDANQALRILPSENSIGFFIAALEKYEEIE